MTTLADAIERDLAALGDHATRATRYVVSGEDDGVLADVVERDVLGLKATSAGLAAKAPREVLRAFGAGGADAFVRLGRVYAATCAKSHIEELAGDLRWAEHLVWEGGVAAPGFEVSGESIFEIAWLARAMKNAAPLASALLVHRGARGGEFARYAFAMNLLGAPDALAFVEDNDAAVIAILRTGEIAALKRLDAAGAPVAPFARTLAKLASGENASVRRAAFDWLAREPRHARSELEAVADDPETTRKERAHALTALEKIFAMLA